MRYNYCPAVILDARKFIDDEISRNPEKEISNDPIKQAIQSAIGRLTGVEGLDSLVRQLEHVRDEGSDKNAAWAKARSAKNLLNGALLNYQEVEPDKPLRANVPPPVQVTPSPAEARPWWAVLWPESLWGRIIALLLYLALAVPVVYLLARARKTGEVHASRGGGS